MIRFVWLIAILMISSSQQSRLVRTKISDNIITKLPSDFILLPPEELANKSASYRMPIAYYTNPMREVDFSVNNSVTRWKSSDLPLIMEIYKSNIKNLFDEVEFISEGIETINDREFITFEFSGMILPGESLVKREVPTRKYIYIQYTINQSMLYIFTFNAPLREQEQWQSLAHIIMHNIKIK